jgi:hypothetical protein
MTRGSDPDGVLAWVEDKIAAVTGLPVGHGEPFNILRYEVGQHYDSHYDSFSTADYGVQASQRVRAWGGWVGRQRGCLCCGAGLRPAASRPARGRAPAGWLAGRQTEGGRQSRPG